MGLIVFLSMIIIRPAAKSPKRLYLKIEVLACLDYG